MAISTVGASGLNSAVSQIGKNLVPNGAMTVQQKGNPATGIGADNVKGLVDMFKFDRNASPQARYTITRETSSGPTGFPNWLKVDVTTAESAVAAGETQGITHNIEAQNLQGLLYGTAGAKAVTLSFYFMSPKTGTHCVALFGTDGSRSFIREFTIASADTWEKFEITFPGDASGTINSDTGDGLRIQWPIICGTTFQASADGWASGQDYATSNQQNLADNTANNIGLAGVQLEVGSVATDFEHEPVSVTLAKCQRYLWVVPTANGDYISMGLVNGSTATLNLLPLPVTMRAVPSLVLSAETHFGCIEIGVATRATTALSLDGASSEQLAMMQATVSSSGMAQGEATVLSSASASATMALTAEL